MTLQTDKIEIVIKSLDGGTSYYLLEHITDRWIVNGSVSVDWSDKEMIAMFYGYHFESKDTIKRDAWLMALSFISGYEDSIRDVDLSELVDYAEKMKDKTIYGN